MVYRILLPMYAIGLFDEPNNGNLHVNVTSAAHDTLARKLSEAGTVLLKNTGSLLPIKQSVTNIAIIGDDGRDNPTVASFGSGHVIPPYIITPYQVPTFSLPQKNLFLGHFEPCRSRCQSNLRQHLANSASFANRGTS
jgi:beta-glucosidase-like glycosyl hydrolase